MMGVSRRIWTSVLLSIAILSQFSSVSNAAPASSGTLPRILLFSKTSPGAFRHDSIPTALSVISQLGSGELALNDSVADALVAGSNAKWQSVLSEDDSLWVDDYLMQFDAVAFVMTADTDPPNSTTLLSATAQQSLVRFVQAGRGFVGIHSAAATLYTFPPYGRLVGAYFDYHPAMQPVGIRALTPDTPATSKFPSVLQLDEEVYHFRTDPRALPSAPTVLLSNATPFDDPQARSRSRSDGPSPRPMAWIREGGLLDAPKEALGQGMDDPQGGPTYSGGPGRMFYTSLGHQTATWQQPAFQAHVAGGIQWVIDSPMVINNVVNVSKGVGTAGQTGASFQSGAASHLLRWQTASLGMTLTLTVTFALLQLYS